MWHWGSEIERVNQCEIGGLKERRSERVKDCELETERDHETDRERERDLPLLFAVAV